MKYSYTPREIFLINFSKYYWKFYDFLACKIDKLAGHYEKDISKEYEKETALFETTKADSILHIGCGAYPITAMTLAKMNCKNIVAIDKNKRAVKMANSLITKKNLYDLIKIESGDGRSYPLDKFDTIIISSNSIPKLEVLEHVFKSAKPNSKIIVRELCDASRPIVDFINSNSNIKLVKKLYNESVAEKKWESYCTIKIE